MCTTSFKRINIIIYFENLTVKLYIFYTLNIHVKILSQSDIIYYITYKFIFYA